MVNLNITESTFEEAIMAQLEALGYERFSGPDIPRTSSNYSDVFIEDVLVESLMRINPKIHKSALNELLIRIKNVYDGDVFARNQTFHNFLQSGVEISYFDGKEQKSQVFKLLDFENPDRNSFYVVNQWTYVENDEKRPDVVLFINGMPLVVFELKSPSREEVDASDAYLQIQNYLKAIPSFFVPNVFVVLSDLADTRVGTITAGEDRFQQWKSVDGNYDNTKYADYRTMIDGMCAKPRILDIIKNFVCFDNSQQHTVKIIGAYHQYFAVKKAIESTIKASETDGKAGVFWHTQGSGKSISMVFLAHLIQQRLGNPTIIVVNDRNDLDDQLYRQFSRCASFLRQEPVQAESQNHLISLLKDRQAGGIIFSTMQKFFETGGLLSDRRDIVVMADEAHRSQYGLLRILKKDGTVIMGNAGWVHESLPHASFIGFTGTPISLKDKDTQEIFGNYIDIYDMTQAVEDGATKPVFYENRVLALNLEQEKLKEIDDLYEIEENIGNEITVAKSKRQEAAMENIFGAPETILSLTEDIVQHYEKNRAGILSGKALIVAYSRKVAIRIYKQILKLRPNWKEKVAVVMTGSNQDPTEWRDIIGNRTHREELAAKFKDDRSPLKIAIVVDMWLTGFDVPSLSTMYMFKQMEGHNLMQAVARVNRVCGNKVGGLVVDYAGIAKALKQAMKQYTKRDWTNYGDMDIGKTAYPEFQNKLSVCRDHLTKLDYMTAMRSQENKKITDAVLDGSEILLAVGNEDQCRTFCNECKLMDQALSLAKSRATSDEQLEAAYFRAVRTVVIRRLIPPPGDKGVKSSLKQLNDQVAQIIAQSVKSKGVINLFEGENLEFSLFDEAFLKEVAAMKHRNLAVELLKRVLEGKIRDFNRKSLIQSQKFSDRFQKLLNSYINGQLTNAQVIEELVKMAKEIMRHRDDASKLGLNEEEMAFYDAITQPQAVRDFYQNEVLVNLTKELTQTLRENRTIDWWRKESARADMRSIVRRLLRRYKYPPDEEREATDTIIKQCELWVEHSAD